MAQLNAPTSQLQRGSEDSRCQELVTTCFLSINPPRNESFCVFFDFSFDKGKTVK